MAKRVFVIASGRDACDCHFLCYRMPGEEFDWETVESFIGEKYPLDDGDTYTQMLLYERTWITGLWRSAGGAVYLTSPSRITRLGPRYREDAGDVRDFRLRTTFSGIWGLDDDFVFAWGQLESGPAVWHFDGRDWRAVPNAPGFIHAVHGPSRDLVYAVGENGLVARWDGREFRPVGSPTHVTLSSVYVASEDEIYAGGAGCHLIGGSVHGLRLITVSTFPIYAVAKAAEVVWVAAGPLGLHRLDGNTLSIVKPNILAERLEHRGEGPLLITAPDMIAETDDGVRFFAQLFERMAHLVHP